MCQLRAAAAGRRHGFRVEGTRRITGMEAEEAEDAQIVLAHPRLRIADEAHAAGGEILEAVEIIVDDTVEPAGERIHGEIAPRRISLPVIGKGDACLPPEGLDIAAQGRHLDRFVIGHRCHGAVLDASRNGLEARCLQQCNDLFRWQRAGDIDVIDLAPQQGIPHAAADETCRITVGGDGIVDLAGRPLSHPWLRQGLKGRRLRHGATIGGHPPKRQRGATSTGQVTWSRAS